ncbi:MAG: hypothetical protein HY812_08415 [Planctomycetes bacterium]|nr:hypothetical protein [Planctomycetota bacterium]
MSRSFALTVLALLLALALPAPFPGAAQEQAEPPPEEQETVPAEEQAAESATIALPVPEGAPEGIATLIRELAEEGVTVDFVNRVIEVRGVILLDRMNAGYPIEYLIVTEGGFTHEALGMVRATPSKLNAAFLALGLSPGSTVQFVKKEPPPPAEEIISGEAREFDAIPPAGSVVDVAVRWTDEAGEQLRPIEDLIVYITNGQALPRRGFVFVGSRFSRMVMGTERVEKFVADVEGNVVSLYLSGAGSCLFDMNSAEGAEAYLYDINARLCPERGTKVAFVFSLRGE